MCRLLLDVPRCDVRIKKRISCAILILRVVVLIDDVKDVVLRATKQIQARLGVRWVRRKAVKPGTAHPDRKILSLGTDK